MTSEYCCDSMKESVEETKIINYDCRDRTYDINISSNRVKRIFYCPWCNTKIPNSLHKELFNILKSEYGLTIGELDWETNKNVPPEFQSDEWWKKRGL